MDEQNKIIQIYKNGKLERTIPYSHEDVIILREIEEMPVVNEPVDKEKIDFKDIVDFGEVSYLR